MQISRVTVPNLRKSIESPYNIQAIRTRHGTSVPSIQTGELSIDLIDAGDRGKPHTAFVIVIGFYYYL